MTKTFLSVRIAGWLTGRRLFIDGNTIEFEVAGTCNPFCGSCRSRMDKVDGQLRIAGDSVKYRWTSRDLREACYLVLEDTGWKQDEVLPRLGNLLDLRISRG